MTYWNRYKFRYILTIAIMLAAWIAGGEVMAQQRVQIHGNVFGGGNNADVKKNTTVNMSTGTVYKDVFGGGKLGDVGTHADKNPVSVGSYDWKDQDGNIINANTAADKMTGLCTVNITGASATVMGNVFGAGKGEPEPTTFWCEKAMVYTTSVNIENGTVGTLEGGNLVAGTGNVYGGGQVGRVEYDTQVKIGVKPAESTGTSFTPDIRGSVFGAGAGIETHGYSALVRGDCYVTIDNGAKVEHNVYGGGEKATAGKYDIATKANITTVRQTHPEIEIGMPYQKVSGGKCTVIVRGGQIGPDTDANVSDEAGHVFGAGKGVGPEIFDVKYHYTNAEGDKPYRMTLYDADDYNSDGTTDFGTTWAYYTTYDENYTGTKFVLEYYDREKYLKFLQTLSLASETDVTISGNATVKGSVYGGSENGFVQDNTKVTIGINDDKNIGTTTKGYGNVFGGGKGVETFYDAGRVGGNTDVTFNGGIALGSVFGGGELGNVGKFTVTEDGRYVFSRGGKCTISVTGGSIGAAQNNNDEKGNVFGAGKGKAVNFKCDKAMSKETSVSISGGTVNGNVYGGGEVGRVEYDTEVKIGRLSVEGEGEGTGTPTINGSVFGAGRGEPTHGYSALVRGNTKVDVEGAVGSTVNGSVYGGGQIASVGRYGLNTENMPEILLGGGTCEVKVLGNVEIANNVFGAGKGEAPESFTLNKSKRMTVYNADDFLVDEEDNNIMTTTSGNRWEYYDENANPKLVWEYYKNEEVYSEYLKTLALATAPNVTIGGNTGNVSVKGSVFGGGESGLTKGSVTVTINSGTIGTLTNGSLVDGTGDVYGGGSLADTNTTTKVGKKVDDVNDPLYDSPIYLDPSTKKIIDTKDVHPTTIVRLLGGVIYGDAYGGGLGRLASTGISAVAALVMGDVLVDLNHTTDVTVDSDGGRTWTTNTASTPNLVPTKKGCVVNRIFGANNKNGTPKKNVTVHVYATQNKDVTNKATIADKYVSDKYIDETLEKDNPSVAELQAILADQIAVAKKIGVATTNSTDPTKDYETILENAATAQDLGGAISGLTATINETIIVGNNKAIINDLRYDVEAVYGGGNLAAYNPTYNAQTGATDYKTQVIIDGCAYTSIETVYGGGNAAAVPETNVYINEAYEIETVFGGGNGSGANNPGADVGTFDQGVHRVGTGNANSMITGGYIHEAYGGSNTKGLIMGSVNQDATYGGGCDMLVRKIVAAGKNADIMGNAITVVGCMPETWTDEYYGGADNANVHGNVELTITSGNFHKVFGGNNKNGIIMGHIKVNIEEIACRAIRIDSLYLGGNEAPYSMYGYTVKKNANDEPVLDENGKLQFTPRKAGDTSKPVKKGFKGNNDYEEYQQTTGDTFTSYDAQPELNIISCTEIKKVFGGGYGETAIMYANPTVNINMIKGEQYNNITVTTDNPKQLGEIGNVYGGGNAARVFGDCTVNIATKDKVKVLDLDNNYKVQYEYESDGVTPKYESDGVTRKFKMTDPIDVIGAYISGNVYGGGQLADVGETEVKKDENNKDYDDIQLYANTFVNICAQMGDEITANGQGTGRYNYTNVDFTGSGKSVVIGGNVFGGGQGVAKTFRCGKAMVTGNTNICIGNGTVKGTVYGGGQIGRVEKNAVVRIGIGNGTGDNTATSKPVIKGDVFGAGKGVEQYGYAALLRGNTYVTIEGDAKVERNVYGGGEIASVGRYNIVTPANLEDEDFTKKHPELEVGMPWSLASQKSGNCNVTVRGYAEIGTDGMKMFHANGSGVIPEDDAPDDWGHVFGAGKGILPYENKATFNCPLHSGAKHPGRMTINSSTGADEWECYYNADTDKEEAKYLAFVETQALATQTNVVIGDANSNPFVKGSVYGGSENGHVQHDTHVTIASGQIGNGDGVNRRYTSGEWAFASLAECHHWDYDKNSGAPYDKYAIYKNTENGKDKYYYDESHTNYAEGGAKIAKDGHSYYGNVFGGGSGVIPYAPGKWHRAAGSVGGNTVVDITGGHILTSVYGGNEQTDVGTYTKDTKGALVVPERAGKCTVNMTGGTLGVPRTVADMIDHPVTCYLFGAGKGDQRIFFNTWTNVISTEVNITGNARIFGSTFGGGEDGHVICNAVTNIGGSVKIGSTTHTYNNVTIGTTGTSYVDGNIFGGGRGFSGDAQTAGTVGGNIEVNISNGNFLGSIYGGGRLASVGTQFTETDDPDYGNFLDDGNDILYTAEDATNGYIPTGKRVGDVKFPGKHGHITVNISGGTIGNNLEVSYDSEVDTDGMTAEEILAARDAEMATLKTEHTIPNTVLEYDKEQNKYIVLHSTGGNVFGGSMGRLTLLDGRTINPLWPKMAQAKTTAVNISGSASIKRNVYGGGELGTVRDDAYVTIGGVKTADADDNGVVAIDMEDDNCTAVVSRDVYGGGYGSDDYNTKTFITVKEPNKENPTSASDYDENHYVFTPMIFAGCVGKNTYVNVVDGQVRKSVYGGGEMASVGIVDCIVDKNNSATDPVYTDGSGNKYVYRSNHKHNNTANDFILSWPYHFENHEGFFGATHVNVKGGRIGVTENDDDINTDNGDVYGGGKGIAGDYNNYVFCANVGSTEVTIDIDSEVTPADYLEGGDCITGAVYGGAENGHVMGDTKLTLKKGLVGHSMYGGGSGKGQYTTTLDKIPSTRVVVKENKSPATTVTAPTQTTDKYDATIYSITAGKVFGNTEVIMQGGYVVRNVYGGGNLGSVGKGNYAGGADDYSTTGYGEVVSGNLWDNATGNDRSQAFWSSGKSTVKIFGGNVGYINTTAVSDWYNNQVGDMPYTYSGLPYGNVFGGCRGESAPNVLESPRYQYCPSFFSGYVNETEVIIGDPDNTTTGYTGPTIAGSVYGGGMDGHVRRDTKVTINSGEIGRALTGDVTVADLEKIEWLHCGNVYGAGSGMGKYKYDFNYDGDYEDEVEYTTPGENGRTSKLKETDFSTSAGSVTRFTKVEIKGGTIHRNVYGGGSLASVGAPKIGQDYDPYRKGDTAEGHGQGKQSFNEILISGGQIGTATDIAKGYGGDVNGGSRGNLELPNNFSTSIWTKVEVNPNAVAAKSPVIAGNVFGGGEAGAVKHDTEVNMNGGTIGNDLYGGGDMADVGGSTKVLLWGGKVTENAYGGARGTTTKAADVWGDVLVELNGKTVGNGVTTVATNKQGCVVKKIFGCNNVNGTPKGHVKVHVYETQNANMATINDKIASSYSPTGDTEAEKLSYWITEAGNAGVSSEVIAAAQAVLENTNSTEDEIKAQSAILQGAIEGDRYDVAAVYGGGNLAHYIPTKALGSDSDKEDAYTEVIIDGCGLTSIEQVYGGGNAASTPGTNVTVNGTYEINELFGGGNGKDAIAPGVPNPGANVGYYAYPDGTDYDTRNDLNLAADADPVWTYGSGEARVSIYGGTIHSVYGGSNTKGNVRKTAVALLDAQSSEHKDAVTNNKCPFNVAEAYGGGKSADMDGQALLQLVCIDGLDAVYGGAENADVNNDVTLNITNGTYGQVFGGNNIGGRINGSITVNIEETGCNPIIIGELYGGGNRAAYSVYGYKPEMDGNSVAIDTYGKTKWLPFEKADAKVTVGGVDYEPQTEAKKYAHPVVNVKSFTSIGDIFGGGYGATAVMVGDPEVNINVVMSDKASDDDVVITTEGTKTIYDEDEDGTRTPRQVKWPTHAAGKIGAINNVFGGGNAAEVIGTPRVYIGTKVGEMIDIVSDPVLDENGNPVLVTDTNENPVYETDSDGRVTTKQKQQYNQATVVGADIRGNIYGGGNNANVTGDTVVQIGKAATTTTTTSTTP